MKTVLTYAAVIASFLVFFYVAGATVSHAEKTAVCCEPASR